MTKVRFAFAGDRDLSVWILHFLLEHGARPNCLLVSGPNRASHADELIGMCSYLAPEDVMVGQEFRLPDGLKRLSALNLDYIVGVHFPYIVPKEVLSIPRVGVLNLHPAYLPYNRGWHTPSWAIFEGTPAGATLHFMDEGLDTGDIVHQEALDVRPDDTADSLYQRIKQLEFAVFKAAWPLIESGMPPRRAQASDAGTLHNQSQLTAIQPLDLDAPTTPRDLLRRLRALTTNNLDEAAFFEAGDKRYRIQVTIWEDKTHV